MIVSARSYRSVRSPRNGGEKNLNSKGNRSQTLTDTSRRGFIAGAITSTVALTALGQARDYAQNSVPQRYPDRDILVLDPRFSKYKIGNAAIQRLHTGMAWAEGPAWSCGGRYLVWSDIPNDVQRRWLDEDGHVSAFHHLGCRGMVGEGYDGVHIFAPDGQRIGQILLPEICSNICFGGPKRNRLFMTASQSLYAVYVNTQGAHIG